MLSATSHIELGFFDKNSEHVKMAKLLYQSVPLHIFNVQKWFRNQIISSTGERNIPIEPKIFSKSMPAKRKP